MRPWGPLPRSAACALVALFATVFLYHRLYDTVLLIVPLVYALARVRSALIAGRGWFMAACAAILGVLYLPDGVLHDLQQAAPGWGRLVQAVLLPAATWLVLLAMFCLAWGERRIRAAEATP